MCALSNAAGVYLAEATMMGLMWWTPCDVPPNWVAWLKSAEGKEWSKKFLATDEGKAWRQANLVDGKIKTDRNGNPRGPFPINPAYQG